MKFTIPGEPVGKGRPRFNTRQGRAVTPEKTARYETLILLEYQAQCRGIKFRDGDMLDLQIEAFYGIPQSKSKKQKALMLEGKIRPTKKPDFDNIAKIVADGLNEVAYHDDAQIVDCMVRKFYSNQPRLVVTIRTVCDS